MNGGIYYDIPYTAETHIHQFIFFLFPFIQYGGFSKSRETLLSQSENANIGFRHQNEKKKNKQ